MKATVVIKWIVKNRERERQEEGKSATSAATNKYYKVEQKSLVREVPSGLIDCASAALR